MAQSSTSINSLQSSISVLGCGWLGFPLAKLLTENGFSVSGSTTTPAKLPILKEAGIQPFLIDLNRKIDPELANDFFSSEILIINVPPKRNSGNNYPEQMERLATALQNSKGQKIIFVSSTSVYAAAAEEITENSPLDFQNAEALIAAENLFQNSNNNWQTTILRLAGLFGPGRQPGRFLAGKTNLPDADAPVNLIHQEDCVQIILEIIKQEKWGEIFNGCADQHPSRREFYTLAAQKLNLPEPVFALPTLPLSNGKWISNQKLKTELGYTFRFPDPMQAI